MDTATWSGPIGLEGTQTGDGRLILPDALRWENLPVPLRWAQADNGEHLGAVVVGRITDIERSEDGQIIGTGEFDLGSEAGREAYRLVQEDWMTGISMDLDDIVMQEGDSPDNFTVSEGRIRAATLVAVPAFIGAKIAVQDPVEFSTMTMNWVEDVGGLPRYIKRIARHLEREKGFSESHAIATAVNVVKKMCATGDLNWPGSQQVNLKSRAEACAAVTEWELKKAQARARGRHTMDGGQQFKDYSPEMRKKLAEEDEALPDGSFPIHDCEDLHNAIQSIGRAGDPDAAAAHIRKRAKDLDCGVELPESIQAAATTFPAEWFENPRLSGPTALTVTDDGRVFGHVALWASCFAGETEYITAGGIRTLKETVGTTQQVLTSKRSTDISRSQREFGGTWVDAEIRSFGVQKLLKVTLRSRTQVKVIYATPDHRWLVTPQGRKDSQRGVRAVVTTAKLTEGDRLCNLFPKQQVKVGKGVQPSQFGVAHGFTFGDGWSYRDGSRVNLFGAKDAAMLPYFNMSTSWETVNPNGVTGTKVTNLPAFFKDLPPLGESLAYLYGWLAGYFAADGTVTPLGVPQLFSATREHLEFVRDACSRLGIGTSDIKTFVRKGATGGYAGIPGQVNNVSMTPLHRITLHAGALTEAFFIGEEHRARFLSRRSPGNQTISWRVVAVEETERVEEVYCAVVPEFENFTLVDNINVMNCHIASPQGAGVCTQPPRSKSNYSYFKTGAVSTTKGDQAVGVITLSTVHAGPRLTSLDTMRHYEHTGAVGAYVNAGEDEHGIWVAGAARPDADHTALKAAPISGDWRTIGGSLEMVAALSVNVPGFPIPRAEALVAGGQVKSLVASGIVQDESVRMAKTEAFRAQLRNAIAFQKVHTVFRSLTAAGYKPDQWRVPRGNGDASGQWVDAPSLHNLKELMANNGYTPEQIEAELGEADALVEAVATALKGNDGDAAQRAATQAETALAGLDSTLPEELKQALEEQLEAVNLVRSSDLSLLGDESIDDPSTDIGAEDEGEKPPAAKEDGGDQPKAEEEPPAGDDNNTSRVGKLYPTSDRDRTKELENLSVAELHKRAAEAKTLDDMRAIATEFERRLKSASA